MSVYIDDMRAPYMHMWMSHMIADSSAELHAMADRIGLSRRWVQKPGTDREHYDVCQSKREAAIHHGAIAITKRELVAKVLDRSRVVEEPAA